MSITEELRKFAWKECPSKFLERVTGIADDIEQAHTMEIGEVADLFKDCIPLPKDADGVLIHIGDELEWPDGNRLTVNGIGEGGTLFYVDAQGDVQWTASGDKRHVKPDSWERIIEDAAKNIYPNGAFNPCWDEVRDELVERCKRLAGDGA